MVYTRDWDNVQWKMMMKVLVLSGTDDNDDDVLVNVSLWYIDHISMRIHFFVPENIAIKNSLHQIKKDISRPFCVQLCRSKFSSAE